MIAIITGDIVNSRKVPASKWMKVLKEILNKYGSSPKQWEIFRGDHFQLEVNVENAIWTAVMIKSYLKQIKDIDVRVAIGIGDKSYNSKKISESNGTAFVHSGQAFEGLNKNLLAIESDWPELDEEVNLYIDLASLIMNNWTPLTAYIVQHTAENPQLNQQEVAKLVNRTQSNISIGLKRAGYDEIKRIDMRYRKLIAVKKESNELTD